MLLFVEVCLIGINATTLITLNVLVGVIEMTGTRSQNLMSAASLVQFLTAYPSDVLVNGRSKKYIF